MSNELLKNEEAIKEEGPSFRYHRDFENLYSDIQHVIGDAESFILYDTWHLTHFGVDIVEARVILDMLKAVGDVIQMHLRHTAE